MTAFAIRIKIFHIKAVSVCQIIKYCHYKQSFIFLFCNLQGEAVDLKPFDAQLMLPIDKTPVSLLLDGTHVGRGSEWSVDLMTYNALLWFRSLSYWQETL